jgi:hypothetical protein
MGNLEEMARTYRKLFGAGMILLLTGFALLIFQPLGRVASLATGMVVFFLSFIPLELARRTARRMAVIALRENRKA